jgi:hypothetical protein
MAIVGYNASVSVTGTPTGMTSEAMTTNSTVANTYRITSGTKNIWDRTASITFRGSGTTLAASLATVDYLFGKVVFSSTQAEPITVTGTYLPTAVAAGAHSFSLDLGRELLDNTDFTSTGLRSRLGGLQDASFSVTRWDSVDVTYVGNINTGTPVVVEVKPAGTTVNMARGWFIAETDNRSGDVGGLETAETSFQLDATTGESFSWP